MSYRVFTICSMLFLFAVAPAAFASDPLLPDAPTASTSSDSAEGPVDKLRDEGIALRFVMANDWAASVKGGERLGATNGGGAVGGADFDMDKLFGIVGARVRVTFARYYGHSLAANDIGITEKIQGYWYPARQWQLAQLTWEQTFKDEHLTFLFGRLNATWQFNRSTYGCRFVSAPDCPYQLTLTTGGFSGFPYVNWGGKVKYQPNAMYLSLGAFEINPDRRNNHGLDFTTQNATGVMIPLEAGYETSFATDPYPRHYKIGAWYNSADYTDPRLNTRGLPRALVGGAARTYPGGRYGMYLLGDQVIYRPDPDVSTRNLAVFGSVSGPFDNADIYTMQATGGFFWTGPFASRPEDTIGFQASYFRFSHKQVGFEDDTIHKKGDEGTFSRNETMLELNYGYKLFPVVTLVPNLQYIVHPDILGNTIQAHGVPANALVIGLRVMVNMGGPGS
ncbi:MAG TPA: carbohydrate porin [Luteibacter sp.]|nr:carbohydrate porin [Luteibacter sp.]